MHVLVVNIYFAPHSYGGATVVAEEVARALVRDHGARVTAISAMARADLPPYATVLCAKDGIANYMINMPPDRSFVEYYTNPRVAECIAGIARRIGPDVAHLHCVQEIGADAIAGLRAAGIPVILSTHDYWWLCERQFMFRPEGHACLQDPVRSSACRGCVDDIERTKSRSDQLMYLADMADLVTAPSAFARDLHVRSGFARDRFAVWENGVTLPVPDFFEKQARRREQDPRTVFGFLGGPSKMKGWHLIERAFTGLGREGFRGVVVEGSLDGGWWRNRSLSALDGEWDVKPGYDQRSIDDFLAEIDVLLFLSQWHETYGLTVREALSRGIRVIQSEAGGAMEHGAWHAVTTLPIGASVQKIRGAIRDELDQPDRGSSPAKVRSWSDQASEFLEFARPLVMGDTAQSGAA